MVGCSLLLTVICSVVLVETTQWTGNTGRYFAYPIEGVDGTEYLQSTWRYRLTTPVSERIIYFYLHPTYVPAYPMLPRVDCLQKDEAYPIYINRHPLLLEITRTNTKYCHEDSGNLICQGETKWASFQPDKWSAVLAYDCDYRNRCEEPCEEPLHVNYSISVESVNPVTCISFRNIFPQFLPSATAVTAIASCSQYYQNYSEYNFFGLTSTDLYWLTSQMGMSVIPLAGCYKHINETVCRAAMPQCLNNGTVVAFCIEMCQDFRRGCDKSPKLLEWIQTCEFMRERSSGQCIYKPVICEDDPQQDVENATISVTTREVGSYANLTCEEGFKLYRETKLECQYSGTWGWTNGTAYCYKVPKGKTETQTSKSYVVIIAILGGFVVLVIIILTLGFVFKYEVLILSFKYCRFLFCCSRFIGTDEPKKYDAFLAFHDNDRELIQQNIHEKLEHEGFQFFVDYRDGHLGEQRVRYIPEAIAQSNAVIFYISHSFLADNYCQFVLDQAFFQTLEGDDLKIIVLQTGHVRGLKRLPGYLSKFLRRRCVMIDTMDTLMLDKVRFELNQRRNSGVSLSECIIGPKQERTQL